MVAVDQFDVYLIQLDPVIGSEIQKTRPCIIVSPNEMNLYLNTIIIAPMTSTLKKYPSRVTVHFQNKTGEAALDQIRTVDKKRLVKRLGKLKKTESQNILNILQEMFA